MRSSCLPLLAMLLYTSAASPAFAASLTPLGDLPGGDFYSAAWAVSDDGSTVVGNSSSASGPFESAFRWTAASGMVGLGDLPGGSFEGAARGVSGDGSIVVGYSYSSLGTREAFRWTSSDGMVGLGDLPGGGFDSSAFGISRDGSTIVGYGSVASGGQAFRWTAASGMVGLPVPYSEANGVSGDGSVIVGVLPPPYLQGFVWTAASGTIFLDAPALGVSDDGLTVVGYSGDQAFRWTAASGMIILGDGGAYAASGDGSVIVGADSYWTSTGGMERLWDVLVAHGVDPAADGWTSLGALDISRDGRTIVGTGGRNGNIEAFIAVVPRLDGDGDAVPDGQDQCPNTVPGAVVDAAGCPSLIRFDFDRDGDVDASDLAVFNGSSSGPAIPHAGSGESLRSDEDADGDVDSDDFGSFQLCYSGVDRPAPQDGPCALCPEGSTWCDGSCTNLAFDTQYCGGCGIVCGAGQTCSGGACQNPW